MVVLFHAPWQQPACHGKVAFLKTASLSVPGGRFSPTYVGAFTLRRSAVLRTTSPCALQSTGVDRGYDKAL